MLPVLHDLCGWCGGVDSKKATSPVTVTHSDTEKANVVNAYFCSCFNPSHPPLFS